MKSRRLKQSFSLHVIKRKTMIKSDLFPKNYSLQCQSDSNVKQILCTKCKLWNGMEWLIDYRPILHVCKLRNLWANKWKTISYIQLNAVRCHSRGLSCTYLHFHTVFKQFHTLIASNISKRQLCKGTEKKEYILWVGVDIIKKCSVYFSSLSLVCSLSPFAWIEFFNWSIDEAMNHIARFMCLMSTQRTRRILTFKTVN